MRVLAIETASEACSIALFDGDNVVAHDHRVLGRGHAERLIPMIGELPGKGRADRVLVSLGPGSFTGVRVGLAAARALGVAWKAPVVGYPTLALVAAMAQAQHYGDVTVCMNGGHGEWFVQDFGADGLPHGDLASVSPEQALAREACNAIAGNRAKDLADLLNGGALCLESLPDASYARRVPTALLTRDLAPIYGRAPDATPQHQAAAQ